MTDTVNLKVRVQKLGTALSNMVMPNIPILIAWGVLTMFFILMVLPLIKHLQQWLVRCLLFLFP